MDVRTPIPTSPKGPEPVSTTCDARFIPNTPNSAPHEHGDGSPIRCTLDPNHNGPHFDGSDVTGEKFEWRDLDAYQAHVFDPPAIPFSRQTVRVLRAYARGFGVSLPSRIKKDDLVTLAQTLRYGTRADVFAETSRLGASVDAVTFDRARTPVDDFVPVDGSDAQPASVAPCGNCGAPVHQGYDYCRGCLDSNARADEAWREHMLPTTDESAPVEAPVRVCEWFATCDRPAVGHAPHTVLGSVPSCAPCARRLGLNVTPF